jgi:hypothetical protein
MTFKYPFVANLYIWKQIQSLLLKMFLISGTWKSNLKALYLFTLFLTEQNEFLTAPLSSSTEEQASWVPKLYLWILKFEFHIIFTCHKMIFSSPPKRVNSVLCSLQAVQKQVAWICPQMHTAQGSVACAPTLIMGQSASAFMGKRPHPRTRTAGLLMGQLSPVDWVQPVPKHCLALEFFFLFFWRQGLSM